LAFPESLESALSGGATLCEYLRNLKVDTSSPALFFFFTGLKVREHSERHLWESASLKKLKPFINCVTTELSARGETECICGEGKKAHLWPEPCWSKTPLICYKSKPTTEMLKIQPLKTSPKTLHKSQQSLFLVYTLSPFPSFPITRRCSRFLRPSSVVRLGKREESRRSLNPDFCKSPNPNPNLMENPP
jgi:hypothetical protein